MRVKGPLGARIWKVSGNKKPSRMCKHHQKTCKLSPQKNRCILHTALRYYYLLAMTCHLWLKACCWGFRAEQVFRFSSCPATWVGDMELIFCWETVHVVFPKSFKSFTGPMDVFFERNASPAVLACTICCRLRRVVLEPQPPQSMEQVWQAETSTATVARNSFPVIWIRGMEGKALT